VYSIGLKWEEVSWVHFTDTLATAGFSGSYAGLTLVRPSMGAQMVLVEVLEAPVGG